MTELLIPPLPDPPPRVRMLVTDPHKLPRQLRAIRQEQDVSLQQLVEHMPLSYRTMQRIEMGTADVRLKHLAAWVKLLGYELALVYPDANTL